MYGCRLVVGREPHFQHYVEDIVHPTPQAAQQAVCQRAVELNVRGFLVWLQGMELGNDGHILEHDGQINIAEGELLLEDENDRPATELEETEENRVEVAEDAPGFESGGQQGARMDGGTGGGEEMACDEDGTAGEGHTAAAEDSRTNDNGVQNDTGIPSEAVDEAKSRPASTPIKREVDELEIWTPRIVPEEVDWQSQLACEFMIQGILQADVQTSAISQLSLRRRTRKQSSAAKVIRRCSSARWLLKGRRTSPRECCTTGASLTPAMGMRRSATPVSRWRRRCSPTCLVRSRRP